MAREDDDLNDNPACATGKIRLFVVADLGEGAAVALGKDQSHYLITVMRQGEGALVRLFNGRDGEWEAEVTEAHKKHAALALRTQTRPQDAVPDVQLWFAPVKRARLDFLVQKATELGIAAIRPVITRRTIVSRINEDRLRANVIEAAEQCGRLTVPEVLPALTLEKVLVEDTRKVMFCDEGGDVLPARERLARESKGAPWAVLIGPEGGFDAEERAMLHAQPSIAPVSLGPRIMRADTAAIAALTLWQAVLGDF